MPASITQVRAGKDGRREIIDGDVLNIAKQIKAIDPSLHLWWIEKGGYFAVIELKDHKQRLVTTALELDERLLRKIEKIAHPSYDFAGELEKKDKRAEKNKAHRFREQTGEIGERAAHALRKDLQAKNKAFIP